MSFEESLLNEMSANHRNMLKGLSQSPFNEDVKIDQYDSFEQAFGDYYKRLEVEKTDFNNCLAQIIRKRNDRLNAERLAEQRRIEAERLAEQRRLEAERLAEQQRLEAERLAEQQRLAKIEHRRFLCMEWIKTVLFIIPSLVLFILSLVFSHNPEAALEHIHYGWIIGIYVPAFVISLVVGGIVVKKSDHSSKSFEFVKQRCAITIALAIIFISFIYLGFMYALTDIL